MAQQIRFQILKSVSGQEYQLAINGVLLGGKQLDGSSISVSTDMLASMFSMPELSEMLESKKRCEEYTKQMFASNREKSMHYPIKFGFPQKGQCRGSSHPLKMGEFPSR